MSTAVLVILAGLIIVFALGMLGAAVARSSLLARAICAACLIMLAFCCLWGFAATFEPMDAAIQWTWRIGYAALGLGSVGTAVFLLTMGKRPAAPDSQP